MAVAALVLGILGLVVFPLGLVLGLVALALGIVALVRAGNLPEPFTRRGMAITGICLGGMGVLVGGVSMTMLIPALANARESSRRAVCATNQRCIGMGCKIYANDNQSWFPIKMYHEAPEDAGDKTLVSFVGQMGAYRITARTMPGPAPKSQASRAKPETAALTAEQSSAHPSRSLFLLVIEGTCTAKQFICPASGDTEDDLWAGNGPRPTIPVASGFDLWDFKGYPYLSYGYQLPFGRMGKPSENLDPRMAILADKGPYFEAGTPRSDGSVPDQPVGTPGGALTIAGATTDVQLLQLDPDRWRPYNSRNHASEGQNVLFVDGHVEWVNKPIVGVNHDNIYTMQGPGYTLRDTLLGRTPADKMGPFTDTDSVIVP
jgi:prepilin-type processing-associated H-X9-DG protein